MSRFILEKQGAKWWHTDDYHSPNLSKSSLGAFFHAVLSSGAYVGEIWPFEPNYQRSAVYISVLMTDEQKAKIEAALPKIKFRPPPEIHLN